MSRPRAPSGAAARHFEREDTVACVGKKRLLRLGIVHSVHGDAEYDVDEQDSDDRPLAEDQVKVDWYPRGNVSNMRYKRLSLLDRSLMIGEPVKSTSDGDKIGFVMGAEVRGDLLLLPEMTHVVQDVDLGRLTFVSEYDPEANTHVLLDGWIGEVVRAVVRLDLRHARGYKCSLPLDDSVHIDEVVKKPHKKLGGTYESEQWYPGQTVRVPAECIKAYAQWTVPRNEAPVRLRSAWRRDDSFDIKFEVEKVSYDSVEVIWRMCLDGLSDKNKKPDENRPRILRSADLARCHKLENFQYQTAQLGDRMKGFLLPGDELMPLTDWTADLIKQLEGGAYSCHTRDSKPAVVVSPESESYVSMASAADSDVFLSASESVSAQSPQLQLVAEAARSSSAQPLNDVDLCSTRSVAGSAMDAVTARNSNLQSQLNAMAVAGRSAPKSSNKSTSKQEEDRVLLAGGTANKSCKAKRWSRCVRRMGTCKQLALAQRKAAAAARRQLAATKSTQSQLPAAGEEYSAETVLHRTFLDVMWQDGSVSRGVPSTTLSYYDLDLDAHIFFPGAIVQRDHDGVLWPQQCAWGTVQSADNAQRVATVRWFQLDVLPRKAYMLSEQTISTLDLKLHEDYEPLVISTRVIRLECGAAESPSGLGDANGVGQIVGYDPPTGRMRIKWCDNAQSMHYPPEVFKAMLHDPHEQYSDEEEDQLASDSLRTATDSPPPADDDSAWETASEDSIEAVLMLDVLDANATHRTVAATANCAEQSARKRQLDNATHCSTCCEKSKRSKDNDAQNAGDSPNVSSPVPTQDTCSSPLSPRIVDAAMSGCTPGTFETISSVPGDHHFVGTPRTVNIESKHFWKAYKSEIKILLSSLPSGIHVRGFEERIDLYSCVMEGPSGTPYFGGLFAFDVRLPHDYPNAPPQVYYRSYASESLNPNLYQDGKVCVSLLGTWHGKDSELWNAGSNLLQVFASIHGLILNSEPYYNEAGYEGRRGRDDFDERSRRYNEMATVRCVEALAAIAAKPPGCFESFVRTHVLEKAPKVIKTVSGWLSGESTPDFPLLPISEGYKLTIKRQLDKLQRVYEKLRDEKVVATE